MIVLIGIEIGLSVYGLIESSRSGSAQIQAMQEMQRSLESSRQALDSSVALAGQQLTLTQEMIDPSIEIQMADVFHPSNVITVRNTGTQPIKKLGVSLRCFVFRDRFDLSPEMLFQGMPSLGEEHSWWFTPELPVGGVIQKDASEEMKNFFFQWRIAAQETSNSTAGQARRQPFANFGQMT